MAPDRGAGQAGRQALGCTRRGGDTAGNGGADAALGGRIRAASGPCQTGGRFLRSQTPAASRSDSRNGRAAGNHHHQRHRRRSHRVDNDFTLVRQPGDRLKGALRMSNTLADRRPRRSRARAGTAGFTLVEVLVVITIITLIMGLIGPRVLNYLTQSKAKASKIQIESFASPPDLYFLDAGRYPATSERFDSLPDPPRPTTAWTGP